MQFPILLFKFCDVESAPCDINLCDCIITVTAGLKWTTEADKQLKIHSLEERELSFAQFTSEAEGFKGATPDKFPS